ncbi:hypothetical protein PO124_30875 [Bacillus licheniformis]|nr:hypothetical protein [Bacillus licheniformis]
MMNHPVSDGEGVDSQSLLTYLELDKQTIAIATYEIEQILDVVLNGRIEAKRMSNSCARNPECRFWNG